jgi:hypothetical protein
MFGFSAKMASVAKKRCHAAQRLGHIGKGIVFSAVLGCYCGVAEADWGGGISASASDTRIDTTRLTTVDQSYDVFVTGRTLTRLQYLGAFRYRWLESGEFKGARSAQDEIQPSADLTWTSQAVVLRGNYTYREYRDRQQGRTLAGRTAGVFAQTNSVRIPQFTGRYEHTQNVQDLELQGQDTRMRTIGLGTRYSLRRFSASYDYSDNLALNANTGLKRSSVQHNGRFDGSIPLFKQLASVQTSYQIIDRSERERSPSSSATLLSIPAAAGLYAADPSPDFGSMQDMPALIDGDLVIPIGFDINLSGPDVHNFGLDLGAPTTVDRMYLYTDTDSLVNRSLRWAVFTSDDSVAWRLAQGYAPGTFDVFFRRYEIGFPAQTTRFIKLVIQPELQSTAVHPTELRALVTRSDDREPTHSTDHRGGLDVRVAPAKWVHMGAGASILRTEGSFTRLAQEQDGAYSNVRFTPHRWADLSGRASVARTRSPEGNREQLQSEQYNVAWQAQWLATLSTRTTLNRTIERISEIAYRRNDAVNTRAEVQLLPGLAGVSEIGYIENHHLQTGDVVTTRVLGQTLDTQPTLTSTLRLEYRYYALDAKISRVPAFRRIVAVHSSYRLTPLIYVGGDATVYDEPGRTSRTADGLLSWTPSMKWAFSGGVTRTDASSQTGSTLLTGQALFRWNFRTDVSLSYSHTSYDDAIQPGISSARLGFNTRF